MAISGERLKKALKRKGMTQSSLAREIDVTPPAVACWISNGVPSGRVKQIEGLVGSLSKGVSESQGGTKADSPIGASDEHKIPLKKKARKNLREMPGIYFLCDRNGQPLYVGQSSDVLKRITNHSSQKCWYKQGVKVVRYIEIPDENLRKQLEPMLIYLFNPPFNKDHVRED